MILTKHQRLRLPYFTHDLEKVLPNDLLSLVKKSTIFSKICTASYALEINEELFIKDLITRKIDRKQQIVLHSLRIGHIRLTHAYLIS